MASLKLTDYQTSKIISAIFSPENVPAIIEIAEAIVEKSKEEVKVVEKEEIKYVNVEVISLGDGQQASAEGINKLIEEKENLQKEIDKLKSLETEIINLKKENEELSKLINGANGEPEDQNSKEEQPTKK